MVRVKKNTQGVYHLDDTALRWLDTVHGESAVKGDIEEKWNSFLDTADIITDNEYKYKPRRRYRHPRWIAAASVAILLAAGGMWYYGSRHEKPDRNTLISHISEDIRLTLPDGEQILLDPRTENGIVAKHGGVSLIRENGTLIHKKQSGGTFDESESGSESEHELQWSSLVVPRGNLFDLVLEDGTRVWLNAGSQLRFPVAFRGAERRIFIEGEAYFAVACDNERPFIVETPRQDITVSGTEFNVYAYPDEPDERTTLIEGCVTLTSKGNGSVTLIPGQQAVLRVDQYIVSETDARYAAAWRDGIFVLDGNTFDEVLLKLSRWYDFTYSFDNEKLARLTFSGNLRRYEEAGIIFDILRTIAHVTINVSGNHVEISEK